MKIPISTEHPVPEERGSKKNSGRKGDGRQAAILSLKAGESFLLEGSMGSAGTLRWWAKGQCPDREFTSRREGVNVRVWRTK
jgi:hypothetical protein